MNAAARKNVTLADIRMEFVAKVASRLGIAVVSAAFIYSYANLWWLSEKLGSPHWALSLLFPFIIDGPSVVASALTVALHDRPFRSRLYAWSVLCVFTGLSWLCNSIHAVEKSTIGDIVPGRWGVVLTVAFAGIPPIGVVLGMHLWAYALRMSVAADTRAEAPVVTKQTKRPPEPETKPETKPETRPLETQKPPPLKVVPPEAPEPDDEEDGGTLAPMTGAEAETAMSAEFDRLVKINPKTKPDASAMHDRLGIGTVKSKATTRRWVLDWWNARPPEPATEDDQVNADEPADDREPEPAGAR